MGIKNPPKEIFIQASVSELDIPEGGEASFAVRLSAKLFDSLDNFSFARIVAIRFAAFASACFSFLCFP